MNISDRFHFLPLPAPNDRSGGGVSPLFDLSSDFFVEPLTVSKAGEKEPAEKKGTDADVRYDSPYDVSDEARGADRPLVRPTVEPRYDAPYKMNKPEDTPADASDGQSATVPTAKAVKVVRTEDGLSSLSDEEREEMIRAAEAIRAAQKARNEAIRAGKNAGTADRPREIPNGNASAVEKGNAKAPAGPTGTRPADTPARSPRENFPGERNARHAPQALPFDPVEALLASGKGDEASPSARHRGNGANGQNRDDFADDTRTCRLKIMIFAGVMVLLFLLGILIPLRPSHSEGEKRDLTPFPAFSFGDFVSGAYFKGIETWYADSFPGREGLIAVHTAFRSLYGFRGEQFTPGGETSDTIGSDLPSDMDSYLESLKESQRAAESGSDSDDTPVIAPVDGEKINGLYVAGNTAYELSYYNETSAMTYAALISRASNRLGSDVQVFDLIVPLSYSIHLPQSQQKTLGVANAGDAIDHIFAAIGQNSDVTTVEVLPTLLSHRDEYLYFRTDHHWTARGAYYAYTAFCETAGITPKSLSDWKAYSFDGFLGTLYSDAGKPAALKNDPDTLEAWVPNGTDDVYITDRDGKRRRYPGGLVRCDTDTFYQNAASKYNCFLMGDHPLCEIHNPDITDGSSIAVVKESFGNAFVPFLVDHYEYVYVIDYRYFGGSLTDFVAERNVGQVLFINNAVAVWSKNSPRLSELSSLIGD